MDEKQTLRRIVRNARAKRAQAASRATAVDERFAEQLATLVTTTGARTVTSFVSVNGEPDTRGFHDWALAHDVQILLPCAQQDSRLKWAYFDGSSMRPGLFGIPEPSGARYGGEIVASADIMFVPAASVDKRGVRLGWGRGFYDRALAEMRKGSLDAPDVFAVLFDEEVVDVLPADLHDEPVTGAVTEHRTYYFGYTR